MSALRAVLFEWDLSRIARILGTGLAAFLALRVTDGLLTGLGATLLFLFVLTLPWEMANRLSDRVNDSWTRCHPNRCPFANRTRRAKNTAS
ncbi:hypothetical protein [Natrinema sp. H-ect4]|uniref:hypothetical protein n=1 Tax=Natrinema sp. H-ect4 TaxID=3242699 RepID=UPI0035A87465